MTSLLSIASPYERWYRHFRHGCDQPSDLPWNDARPLNPAERLAVSKAIQQFQLGEWARGRGLVRRASAQLELCSDPWFLPALEFFIGEEQRHSDMLGRFLDREHIPRLTSHWLDGAFRRLRKLAGLELCAVTLVTAEVLAIPFYRALRDATRSPLLRAICVRILCDEAAHLDYQALTLGLVRRPLREPARAIRSVLHSALFYGTALLLWGQYRRVFLAAGCTFQRFWTEACRSFAFLDRRIRQVSFDDRRLD